MVDSIAQHGVRFIGLGIHHIPTVPLPVMVLHKGTPIHDPIGWKSPSQPK